MEIRFLSLVASNVTLKTLKTAQWIWKQKRGNDELSYNQDSVIPNIFLGQIGYLITQIKPVTTNPGYKEHKCYKRVLLFLQNYCCTKMTQNY